METSGMSLVSGFDGESTAAGVRGVKATWQPARAKKRKKVVPSHSARRATRVSKKASGMGSEEVSRMERLSEYVGIFAGSVARGEVRSKGVWVEARGTSGFAVEDRKSVV